MAEIQPNKMQLRFKEVRNKLELNQVEFAELTKIKQSHISAIERGSKNITAGILLMLEDKININRKWIESGEGQMFKNGDNSPPISPQSNPRLEAEPLHLASDPNDYDNDGAKFEDLGDGILRMRIKVVPVKAYAGYLRGFQDPEFYEDLKTVSIDVYKEYHGHYLAFEVMGDSMTPSDPSLFEYMALPGWKAIARELLRHHWKYKLHTHNFDTWIIVHNTEGILIKNIIAHDVEKGTITIHSLNPNYPDETLSLDDIAQIFSVVKYIIEK